MDRGVIAHRKRAQQIIDYSGLRFGNITPTDIDGLIEYHGKCFILLEYKHRGKDLPTGQRRALEAMADSLNKPAILIVAEHHVDDASQDIPAESCRVRESYVPGFGWRKGRGTVKALVDAWINFVEQ